MTNNKLSAKDFDPQKNYVSDGRGETVKISQEGKTAEFSDSDTALKFVKNSNFTVR